MTRWLRPRLSAFLLVPALLYANLARGGELFRCAFDQVVRDACCCPNQQAQQTGDRTLRADAPMSCCDVRTVEVDKSPKDSPRTISVAPPLEASLLCEQQATLDELRPTGLMTSGETACMSPPILRQTCSLLI